MSPLLGLFQIEEASAGNDCLAESEKLLEDLFQGQNPGLPVNNSKVDHPKGNLHGRAFVELAYENFRADILFQVQHDPNPVPVGLIPKVLNTLDLLLPNQVSDLFDQFCLVHRVGQLCENNALPVCPLVPLDQGSSTYPDDPFSRPVGIPDPLLPVDDPAGGKIRTGNVLQEIVFVYFRVLDESDQSIHQFTQIVRRNVRCHANRDSG